MRILVTNDDGIDSTGLHILARSLTPLGEVVVGAPDTEYSGASSSFGALHLIRPEMQKAYIDGIEESWAINGPPALCVMFAQLGALGPPFDLVVSGINPGANVGRSVYHSGTIGAALTARNGGVTGIAVSQAIDEGGYLGQGLELILKNQKWHSAADAAAIAAACLIENPLPEPEVLNINVPNLEKGDIKGWRDTEVGTNLIRSMSEVSVEPKSGHEGTYHLKMSWGDKLPDPPIETDVGAVSKGYISLSWLSRLHRKDPPIGSTIEDEFTKKFPS